MAGDAFSKHVGGAEVAARRRLLEVHKLGLFLHGGGNAIAPAALNVDATKALKKVSSHNEC